MSHSKKDGRKGGGHHQKQRSGYEYWSRRANGHRSGEVPGREGKTFTHRYERRCARREIIEQATDFLESSGDAHKRECPADFQGLSF